MGKGKKKKANKGKKRDVKKTEDTEEEEGNFSRLQIKITPEQRERARLAAANRTEDPLKNWTRLQNEECPICMLPLPFRNSDTNYCITCGKTVCMGCVIGVLEAHKRDGRDAKTTIEKATTCPCCRSNTRVYDDKYALEQEMKRANTGNGEAKCQVGTYYFDGVMGLRQDKAEGLKWYNRAAEAGSGKAAFNLGVFYWTGDGVEEDNDKALEHLQKAAERGSIPAFQIVGMILMERGDIEEAFINLRKAAMCGLSNDYLFSKLRNGFKYGYITKDEYAFTLRENQKACNEMKSDGRERWKRCNTSR